MNILRSLFITISHGFYRALRPVIFLVDSERVHNIALRFGNAVGKHKLPRWALRTKLRISSEKLTQSIDGITFENPVGLAAGFDYKAELTQVLPSLGFGFETIGTVTKMAYDGNPPPRLGRLPKSKSLMVNKGFKSEGIDTILKKLSGKHFEIPVGLSIGQTNTSALKTLEDAIEDICDAFRDAESSPTLFSYYELNISCPNLQSALTFYEPEGLNQLLLSLSMLEIENPIYIKMPIDLTNSDVQILLDVILAHSIRGVIFGNLQKNRNHPSLNQEEVKQFTTGNFSGKPTEQRSDELVSFSYRHVGNKLTIIGCGGIFTAEDTYRKIKKGASLVQLITGLVYEGPQLAAQINRDLLKLLRRDGHNHISQVIGTES